MTSSIISQLYILIVTAVVAGTVVGVRDNGLVLLQLQASNRYKDLPQDVSDVSFAHGIKIDKDGVGDINVQEGETSETQTVWPFRPNGGPPGMNDPIPGVNDGPEADWIGDAVNAGATAVSSAMSSALAGATIASQPGVLENSNADIGKSTK